MEYQRQPSPFQQRMQSTVSWWLFLTQVGAVSVEVFLHKRFGSRYCRLQALMVVPLGIAYAWMWNFNGYDIRPLMYFFVAYVVALLYAQIGILVRLRRGDQVHSMYNGFPTMLKPSQAHRERTVKLWAEPLLVGGVGLLLHEINEPLGWYLLFATASLIVCNIQMVLWQRRQVVDLQDAVIEQTQVAGTFRGY